MKVYAIFMVLGGGDDNNEFKLLGLCRHSKEELKKFMDAHNIDDMIFVKRENFSWEDYHPNIIAEEMEVFEEIEKMGYKIYKTKGSLRIVGDEIHSLEVNYGCNGVTHALCIVKLYMDENGNTINGEHVGDVVIGMCDRECKKDIGRLGEFMID